MIAESPWRYEPEEILADLLGLDRGLRREAYYGERSIFYNPGARRSGRSSRRSKTATARMTMRPTCRGLASTDSPSVLRRTGSRSASA